MNFSYKLLTDFAQILNQEESLKILKEKKI